MTNSEVRQAAVETAHVGGLRTGAAKPTDWGWLPALSVTSGFSLLLAAFADTGARDSASWAEPVMWASIVLLFAPIALRLASATAKRWERIGLVTLLTIALYGLKVVRDPLSFSSYDELANWRTTADVLQSQHLFHANPIERVNPDYPALGIVTSALAATSGLSIFSSGLIVVGAARLLLLLALYLLYERVGGSARVAGMATALYVGNPSTISFDQQFAYESLALPLAVLAVYSVLRYGHASGRVRLAWGTLAVTTLSAVVVAHHLTSYALATLFVLWACLSLCTRPRSRAWLGPAVGGLVTLVFILGWTTSVASGVVSYLSVPLVNAVNGFWQLVSGHAPVRKLNQSYAGQAEAPWAQAVSYASVLFILLELPFGLWRIWKRYRYQALALVLVVVTLAYPATLALRLTRAGTETSSRSSEFLFVGLALVLAVGVAALWLRGPVLEGRRIAFSVWATVIFVGGVVIGWGPTARLPGPYLVAADTRSIEPEGIDAAMWARASLGPGNRVLADRINRQLMGSYGDQSTQEGAASAADVSNVFLSLGFGPADRKILAYDKIRYLVVDRRLTRALPIIGIYYSGNERSAYVHKTPLSLRLFTKFDHINDVSRIYDSGHIQIYDVGGISGCSQTGGTGDPCSDRP